MRVTGAQIIAVAGLFSAASVGAGGLLELPWLVGVGGLQMIIGNVWAFLVEHRLHGTPR